MKFCVVVVVCRSSMVVVKTYVCKEFVDFGFSLVGGIFC